MVKTGIFKRSIGFIATTLCVAMISTSFAAPQKEKGAPDPSAGASPAVEDGNNGNGNDPGGSDPSNPGKGKGNAKNDPAGDGNNGNGNDPSGSDPSNPGKGKGNDPVPDPPLITNPNTPTGSVLALLGVSSGNDPEPSDPEPGSSPAPVITPPTTVTNNPFGEPTNSGSSQGNATVSTTTLPYGSVPLIANDAASIDYLLQKMLADAKTSAKANGQPQEMSPAAKKVYADYARRLAKTLSKLTPEQQDFVFYGVTK